MGRMKNRFYGYDNDYDDIDGGAYTPPYQKITNPYDDGTYWDDESDDYIDPYRKRGSGIASATRRAGTQPGKVPEYLKSLNHTEGSMYEDLKQPKSQINYYTNELNKLGQQPVAPDTVEKSGFSSILGGLGKVLEWATVVPASVGNAVAGAVHGITKEGEEQRKKGVDTDSIKSLFNGELWGAGLNKGFNSFCDTYKDLFRDDKKATTFSDAFWYQAHSKDEQSRKMGELITQTANPLYHISKALGASEDTAQGLGAFGADLGASILTGKVTDINGAGKALKYLKNTDKIQEANKIASADKAMEVAKKSVSKEDYFNKILENADKLTDVEKNDAFNRYLSNYAQDIQRTAKDSLTGLGDFKGLDIGKFHVGTETLDKIASNKVSKYLTEAGLSMYSPFGAVMSSKTAGRIGDKLSETKAGQKFNEMFRGGRNNDLINTIKNNKEDALEFANEAKQRDISKYLKEKSINETADKIKEFEKEGTNVSTEDIEKPFTETTEQVEKDVVKDNPDYIEGLSQIANDSIAKKKAEIEEELANINKESEKIKANPLSRETAIAKKAELESRLKNIKEMKNADTADFNKQLIAKGVEEPNTELFDDALKMDVKEFAEKHDMNLDEAEKYNQSAYDTLDYIDKQVPGIGKYYAGSEKFRYKESPKDLNYDKFSQSESDVKRAMQKNNPSGEIQMEAFPKNIDNDLLSRVMEGDMNKKYAKVNGKYIRQYPENFRADVTKYIQDVANKHNINLSKEYVDDISTMPSERLADEINMINNKARAVENTRTAVNNVKEVSEYLGERHSDSGFDNVVNMAKDRVEGKKTPSYKYSKDSIKNPYTGKIDSEGNEIRKSFKSKTKRAEEISAGGTVKYEGKKLNTYSEKDNYVMGSYIAQHDNVYQKANAVKEGKAIINKITDKDVHEASSITLSNKQAKDVVNKMAKQLGLEKWEYRMGDIHTNLTGKPITELDEGLQNVNKELKKQLINTKYKRIAESMTNDEMDIALNSHKTLKSRPTELNSTQNMLNNQRKAIEDMGTPAKKGTEILEGNVTLSGKDRDKWIDNTMASEKRKLPDGDTRAFEGKRTYTKEEMMDRLKNFYKDGELAGKKFVKNEDGSYSLIDYTKKNSRTPLTEMQKKSLASQMNNEGDNINSIMNKGETSLSEDLNKVDKVEYKKLNNTPAKIDVQKASDKELYEYIFGKTEEPIEQIKETAKESVKPIEQPKTVETPISNINSKEKEILKPSTPLQSVVKNKVKNKKPVEIEGHAFNTPNGKIVIDKKLQDRNLSNVATPEQLSKKATNSTVIFSADDINGKHGVYSVGKDTAIINATLDESRTIAQHEIGHAVFQRIKKLNKQGTAECNLYKSAKAIAYMPKDKQQAFADIVEYANKNNKPTLEQLTKGGFTNYISTFDREANTNIRFVNESFAELYSLYNNSDNVIAQKVKELSPKAYEHFNNIIGRIPDEQIGQVTEFVRKNVGEEYAKQLNSIRTVMKAQDSIKEGREQISTIKDQIDEIASSMNRTKYNEATKAYELDTDELEHVVSKYMPKETEAFKKTVERYKKTTELVDKIVNIDNNAKLTPKQQEYIKEYRKEMLQIAKDEKIFGSDEEAEAHMDYILHDFLPGVEKETTNQEKVKKYMNSIKFGYDKSLKERQMEGSIAELNNQSINETGRKIWEDNVNRLWMKRKINSENYLYDEKARTRVLDNFGHKVIRDFKGAVDNKENLIDALQRYNLDVPEDLDRLYYEAKDGTNKSKSIFYDIFMAKYGKMSKSVRADMNETFSAEAKARELCEELGLEPKVIRAEDNIPVFTDTERREFTGKAKLIENNDNKVGQKTLTPEGIMPWEFEKEMGDTKTKKSYIQAYKDYIYTQAKKDNMVIVRIPKEEKNEVTKRVIEDFGMENARDTKTNLSQKIREAFKKDRKAIQDFEPAEKYVVVEPKDIKQETFQLMPEEDMYIVNKDAWESYQNLVKESQQKDKNALLNLFDKYSNVMKAQMVLSGRFHVNNTIGNIFNSFVAGGVNLLNPKIAKDAFNLMHSKNPTSKIGKYTHAEILSAMRESGLLETQLKNEFTSTNVTDFIKGKTNALESANKSILSKINPLSINFLPYKLSSNVGEGIESFAKYENVISHLKNGMSISDAIDLTKKALFDYSDLTKFEANVMKRIVPFYTFVRKNIPLQIDSLANNTAVYARINQSYRNASKMMETDKERANKPDYMSSYLPIGKGKYIDLNLPINDLNKSAGDFLNMVHPAIRTPLEIITNKQFFNGYEVSKNNKLSEKALYALRQATPIQTLLGNIKDSMSEDEDKRDKANRVISNTLGIPLKEMDIKKAEKQSMYKYVKALQNQYYDVLDNDPKAKEKLEHINDKGTPLSKLQMKSRMYGDKKVTGYDRLKGKGKKERYRR
ncbi:hypothetical protein [Inconstantimicrobium porci]|uniref:hypothetical protein n=1 Tax=Inconstantimicrobium porci TaxID=2652291 RepID=UPI00240936F6|nr:hypothetical protein [Inconstantimicrobium porci]MDD6769698.1 hypothetical protein [Inconstantimicrobium porci]